jgi:hypothetical protein
MRRALTLLLGVLPIALLAACGARSQSAVADPRVGRVFYLCCNVHYDPAKPEITDAIPTRGSLIPLGTRVEVQKVTKDTVRFEAAGHPAITLSYDHAGKRLPFSAYLNDLFVTDDPRLKLKKVPAREVKLIEKGTVAPGMSRDQVLMALGYPPGDRTPSLDAATWTYAPGSGEAIVVYFTDGRVSSVQRQAGRRAR